MNKFSMLTHFFAMVSIGIGAWFETPAGHAVLVQYPHLVPIIGTIGVIAGLYKNPTGADSK